jgi:hypothetical protein
MDRFGAFLLKATLEKEVSPPQAGPSRVVIAESFGHVTNPYPREYRALSPDLETLERATAITTGALRPSPEAIFDPAGDFVTRDLDLWPRFVGASIALFLLDVLVRRVRWLESDSGRTRATLEPVRRA